MHTSSVHQGDAPDHAARNRPVSRRRHPYNRHSDPSTPHHHQKTEGVADAAADHVVDADAHLPDEDGKVGETMDG